MRDLSGSLRILLARRMDRDRRAMIHPPIELLIDIFNGDELAYLIFLDLDWMLRFDEGWELMGT